MSKAIRLIHEVKSDGSLSFKIFLSAMEKYKGSFLNEKFHGEGHFYFKNGTQYKGVFNYGEITGYGILFKNVVNKYVVVDKNNLDNLETNLGIDLGDFFNLIDNTKSNEYFNFEELKPIFNKYLESIIDQIPESCYSKIKKDTVLVGENSIDASGYKIELNRNETLLIIKNVLEKAKDDQELYAQISKILNDISFDQYNQIMNIYLEELNQFPQDEDNNSLISMCVYKKGKDTIKLSFKIVYEEKNLEVSIEKAAKGTVLRIIMNNFEGNDIEILLNKVSISNEQENTDIKITVKSDEEENVINMNFARTGLLTGSSIKDVLALSFVKEGISFNIKFENETDFSKTPVFAEFKDDNYMIINDLSEEQLEALFMNLGNLLYDKLKDEELVSYLITSTMSRNNSLENLSREAIIETQEAMENEESLSNGGVNINGTE